LGIVDWRDDGDGVTAQTALDTVLHLLFYAEECENVNHPNDVPLVGVQGVVDSTSGRAKHCCLFNQRVLEQDTDQHGVVDNVVLT
jgi:hypothetical protein